MKDLDDPDLKFACVRTYDDWIAEFPAHDRIAALVRVNPVHSSQDAQKELHRGVAELHR